MMGEILAGCGCRVSLVTIGHRWGRIIHCPRHAAADAMYEAAQGLALSLPDSELDLAREVWGNTNVSVIIHWRDEVKAALVFADGKEKE